MLDNDVFRHSCDLLKNIYLCGSNNNLLLECEYSPCVVICLKISIFVVATTTRFLVICCLSKGYKVVEGNKNGTTKRNPTSLEWDFCFLLG